MFSNKNQPETLKNFYCEICDYSTSRKCDFNSHLITLKHKNAINSSLSQPKTLTKFYCENCDYKTCKISNYNEHLLTKKHKKLEKPQLKTLHSKYQCEICNKEHNNYSGLWRHKKKCVVNATNELCSTDYTNDIINKLIQENQLLMKQHQEMIEQNQEMMKLMVNHNNTTTNNNTINGNANINNKFNINVFLNEKCKDAINLSDFIQNIEVSHEDLENNVQLGFVNGMSKIILDNLKQLSIYERPMHCTDVKRETMYIKDENKWEKEEDTKKLNDAIRQVSRKSMATLCHWREENPECQDVNSDLSNKYMLMTQKCSAGGNRDVLYPKVIRALAKETVIDKNQNLIE